MRSLVVVVVLVAGCQRHKADCSSAVSGAIDRMLDDAKGKMPPAAAANMSRVVPQMKKVLTSACVDDKWSPQVIACIDKAHGKLELDACDAQLTPEQKAAEHRRQDEILKTAVEPIEPPAAKARAPQPDPHAGLGLGSSAP
jgi:hypothetical protein